MVGAAVGHLVRGSPPGRGRVFPRLPRARPSQVALVSLDAWSSSARDKKRLLPLKPRVGLMICAGLLLFDILLLVSNETAHGYGYRRLPTGAGQSK